MVQVEGLNIAEMRDHGDVLDTAKLDCNDIQAVSLAPALFC